MGTPPGGIGKSKAFRRYGIRDEDELYMRTETYSWMAKSRRLKKERGYPMEELCESDLLDIVEEQKGIVADSSEWNDNWGCIEYRYQVA